MLPIEIDPRAERELLQAVKFYATRVAQLGAEFLDAADAAFDQIAGDPLRYRIVKADIRRHRMKRFRFAVLYRVLPDRIRVLAIAHPSRHPSHWEHRINR